MLSSWPGVPDEKVVARVDEHWGGGIVRLFQLLEKCWMYLLQIPRFESSLAC